VVDATGGVCDMKVKVVEFSFFVAYF
jgi:hypothetical protein